MAHWMDEGPFVVSHEGDCPECGSADEPLAWAECGQLFCWDCFWRDHERYAIPEPPKENPTQGAGLKDNRR